MINAFDRVYCSPVASYGRVSEVIKTGIAGIVQYRVELENGDRRIFGSAFVQLAAIQTGPTVGNVVAMPRGRAGLRLVARDGVAL